MKITHMIILVCIILLMTGCAGFDTPRLPVPFVVLETHAEINKVPSMSDEDNWGQEDYWATPKEFYDKDRGDCEDYAIAKYFALRQAGIPASKMLLAVIELDSGETAHAVLLVKYKEIFVLDNLFERVVPAKDYLDNKLLYTFNEHGVRFPGLNGVFTTAYLPKWQNVLNKMRESR